MNLELLPYAETDFVEAVALFIDVFNAPPWNENWNHRSARSQLDGFVGARGYRGWCAKLDGSLVGVIMGWTAHDRRGIAMFVLVEMYVAKRYQRLGIGSQLLAHAENSLRSEVRYVLLSTSPAVPAPHFYAKNGYMHAGRGFQRGTIAMRKDL